MRLISLKVTNYRIHRELEVEFDRALTLIGGPNESGKSTLAEAVFNGLFMRARRTGADLKKLVSRHGGHPEVELSFEEFGKTYRVKKVFRGAQGTVVLGLTGGKSWNGDEAEEHLAGLCGIHSPESGGKGAAIQWAHLWVRQGESGSDPTILATARRDSLISLLQRGDAAATILQSELDARVAAQISTACDAIYGSKGPRVDSDLGRATAAAMVATRGREQSEATYAALEQAAVDFESAQTKIAEAESQLVLLRSSLTQTRRNLAGVAELRAREKDQMHAAALKDGEFQSLDKAHASIRKLTAAIAADERALIPRQTELTRLQAAETLARENHAETEKRHLRAVDDLRDARIFCELASLWVQRFEQSDKLGKLKERAAVVHALRAQLVAIPSVSASDLQCLQTLDRDREKLASALDAISTRIELLSGNLPVAIDGKPFDVHSPTTFSNDVELMIGDTTVLRITPGGGTNLIETRQKLAKASASLQSAMDALGVTSVQAAAMASAKRREIEVRLEGSERVDQELADAGMRLASTDEEISRRAASVPEFVPPPDSVAAGALLADSRALLARAETVEKHAATAVRESSRALEFARTASQDLRDTLQQTSKTLDGLKGQWTQLVATTGDDDQRERMLCELGSSKRVADAELAKTREALAGLQPENLAADEVRLSRAIEEREQARGSAAERLAVARRLLHNEGTTDPSGDLARARAAEIAATDRLSGAQRHAQALQLLKDVFAEEQQALTDQFTRPLADKVSVYLQCLFGPLVAAQVTLVDGEFEPMTLSRHAAGAFAFQTLSGGTMEQVGVAFRLAMAEILAQDHGGCLPVILDDAFVNSDPERIAGLQRMLDVAASRGLQIIVLSCTPSDYTALGAKQIALPAAHRVTSNPPALESEATQLE